ncbi:DUF421 domain-containing protein [Roseovarius amoyensis]|uniref:DUF421 domain-containing protein n=1 Tax=Roseovarius amoyensis TaxID=2211448 RepID=UPI000DBE1CA6|nr:YetF domain-containing protein [Roseovarius amoyensis]
MLEIENMLFDNWADLLRVVLVGTMAYGALVAMLRVSGKRTLAKLNAFDLVVTVALGSTLATILLSKTVPLAEGLVALFMLIGLQWVVAAGSVRSRRVARLVRSEPQLLVYRGEVCHDTLHRERVTEAELDAILRSGGLASAAAAQTVVLESDGSFSITARHDAASTRKLPAGAERMGPVDS